VAGIGDSVMFGWGVEEEETYLRLLERRLAAVRPDVETVNMAVPGYNTVQEVAHLERHLDAVRPAWVLLGFVGNDFEPTMTLFPPRRLLERHSWLYRLVRCRLEGFTPEARTAHRRRSALEALRRLGRLSRERGFSVAAFLYAGRVTATPSSILRDHPEVHAVCEQEGFLVLEPRRILQQAIAAGEIETSFDIWISKQKPVDPHPSALGHRIIARGLAEALVPRLRDAPRAAP
jgi:lysophospholipase L1-like esterase